MHAVEFFVFLAVRKSAGYNDKTVFNDVCALSASGSETGNTMYYGIWRLYDNRI